MRYVRVNWGEHACDPRSGTVAALFFNFVRNSPKTEGGTPNESAVRVQFKPPSRVVEFRSVLPMRRWDSKKGAVSLAAFSLASPTEPLPV